MKLLVLDGPMQGKEFQLKNSCTIIGRKQQVDIPLDCDSNISRFHCQILQSGKKYFLEDLGSSNGTWLAREQKVQQRIELQPHTVFRTGQTRLCLLEDWEFWKNTNSAMEKAEPASEGQITIVREGKPNNGLVTQISELISDHSGEFNITDIVDPEKVKHVSDVEQIQLLKTRIKIFQYLSESMVGKVRSTDLLEAVIDHIMSTIPAERGFIFFVPPDRVWSPVVSRCNVETKNAKISRTILEKAVRERFAFMIHDTHLDYELSMQDSVQASLVRSALCVPLVYQNNVKAVIYADARQIQAFKDEDLQLVTAIANQAAVALENTKLYEDLQRAYQELQSAQDRLAQTEKLSTIGTLAASLAHDMRNILTPIIGVSSLVMNSYDIQPALKEAFERQIQRLKALIQVLLSFSKPSTYQATSMDIRQTILESLKLVETEARHHKVEIKTEFSPELSPIYGSPHRLDQVFINLALNAIQAMGEKGGTLTITTTNQTKDIVISFSDTGAGIKPEHVKMIFEPFFTTKGQQGTGLGLFSCKQIVEKEHGGQIELQTESGKGATFIVRLPKMEKFTHVLEKVQKNAP